MPPLNHLRAFEAAVRHESFTRAANELHVTQGAVSRHIRHLEEYLGFGLFERFNNNLVVAPEARRFCESLTRAFNEIDRASQVLRHARQRSVIKVHGDTNFMLRWLIPRLPGFQAVQPRIEVQLSSSREAVDFGHDGVDAAIRFGRGQWPGCHADALFPMEMVPVCTPALAERLALAEPQDILRATLYHAYARREEWPRWFRLVSEQPFEPAAEAYLEDATVVLQCVLAGMGIGLTHRHYVLDELQAARLVIPFDVPLRNRSAFYFVCPEQTRHNPAVAAFREWLVQAAQQCDSGHTSQGQVLPRMSLVQGAQEAGNDAGESEWVACAA
ncbi:transcriptional regulator GcvA [Pseudorhodoferax sp. Leaf267]|uniref:transcriptional regulator GcvA n=1 Tax=Pseudorhodoferax sp. Leaf267 TaxID=1736316 RepID=UPI0006F4FD86|nr:transcriptional regulator GcvA [Pseudorhodoferax sp. Leaf267]KQP14183.1 hypothetical protein ASF43_15235 [Pseudorhodoferax sp. Leaf267]